MAFRKSDEDSWEFMLEKEISSRQDTTLEFLFLEYCENGIDQYVSLMIEKRDFSSLFSQASLIAAKRGHTRVVEILISTINFGKKDDIFLCAIIHGHDEMVKMLLDHVDPSMLNNTAIVTATLKGHKNIVKILLEDERVNPSISDNYAFDLAMIRGYIDIAQLLARSINSSLLFVTEAV